MIHDKYFLPLSIIQICQVKLCYDDRFKFVTCGIECAEKLCKQGNPNPKICDVSISLGKKCLFSGSLSQNTFISIAIAYLKFLVNTNVVKPVTIMPKQLVCCVDADPSLVDTLFAEARAKSLRINGHHSFLKPDRVILCTMKVNSNRWYLTILIWLLFPILKVEKKFKGAWKGSSVCPSIKKIYKIMGNESFYLPYDRYKFVWLTS